MAGIIVYSEKSQLALELVSAAREIAAQGDQDIRAVALNDPEQAAVLSGSGVEVYAISAPKLLTADTAALATALSRAAEKLDASIILLSSDRRGKELAGRLAQQLEAGCLTDVKGINADGTLVRNALGGATVATQAIKNAPKVIAVSPKAFPAAEQSTGGSIQDLFIEVPVSTLILLEKKDKDGDRADIEAAGILVVVGQGVEEQSLLSQVEKIAFAIGGEIACSKPVATDRKWFSEERIIGLSGKICKPELALILGVSGQVQFIVGIREAGTIVSINSDENAYMNQMSDYVLVADLKEVLPELAAELG